MLVVSTIGSLEAFLGNFEVEPPLIVGVDGASTAGKTYLAEELGQKPGTLVISTDNFHEGLEGARYQDRLRVSEIRAVMEHAFPDCGRVVVDGICLRDTFAALGVEPHVYVYCKHLSLYGVWNDDPEYNHAPSGSRFQQGLIDRWSLEYHRRVRPHENANVTWERRDGP